jgi:hypothetical protein
MRRCALHADKILTVDDLTSRLLKVSHSNDPTARALTLHMYMCVCSAVQDSPVVHHIITHALHTATDAQEQRAAYAAAVHFAKQSK